MTEKGIDKVQTPEIIFNPIKLVMTNSIENKSLLKLLKVSL